MTAESPHSATDPSSNETAPFAESPDILRPSLARDLALTGAATLAWAAISLLVYRFLW